MTMRIFLALVLIVILMAAAGWIVFNFGGNSATVELHPEKMKQDTSETLDRAGKVISGAGKELRNATD